MAYAIRIYSLSTCPHCAAAKDYLDELETPYDCVYVDRLSGEERNTTMAALNKLNPALSFPTIVIGEKVIPGFRKQEIEDALKACLR